MGIDSFLEFVDGWLGSLGPWAYVIFALAALIEYLAPPFPGDTVALLGGAYAAEGQRSLLLVVVVLMVGNFLGIAATWRVGLALGVRLSVMSPEQRILGISVGKLQRAQVAMREKGAFLLIINRFLPTFRTSVYLAAGASGVPLSRALILGGISAALWTMLLVSAGVAVGHNSGRIDAFFSAYRSAALAVAVFAVAVLLFRFAWLKWRRRHT